MGCCRTTQRLIGNVGTSSADVTKLCDLSRRGNLAKAHELSWRVSVTANEHEVAGALVREFAMRTPLLIVLIAAIVIGAGGGSGRNE